MHKLRCFAAHPKAVGNIVGMTDKQNKKCSDADVVIKALKVKVFVTETQENKFMKWFGMMRTLQRGKNGLQ